MAKQKKQKEERKEIKIIRFIPEEVREIKKEEKPEEVEIQELEPEALGSFEGFISREMEERPVSILSSGEVQNLEQDLAMIPNPSIAGEEENAIKYGTGGGYGKLGYGDFSYEANKEYKAGMEQPMLSTREERLFSAPRNTEAEGVREATRSAQDRAMDYASRPRQEEEKKRRRAEG